MADIPGNLDKMNDIEIAFDASVSEQLFNKLGANINALIDASSNVNLFTANDTLVIPENLTRVFVLACGGGGGGGGGQNGIGAFPQYSSQGGAASLLYLNSYPVTALETLTITVGTGGSGGSSTGTNDAKGSDGASGSATTVSGLAGTLTFFGGAGGRGGGNGTAIPNGQGEETFRTTPGGNILPGAFFIFLGGNDYAIRPNSANYSTSTGAATASNHGWPGAPSDFGVGGAGVGATSSGNSAPATSYGAGGSGSGGVGAGLIGGTGAGGACIIFW